MPVKKQSAPALAVGPRRLPEWVGRACLLVFSPVIFVLLAELALRLFGYGDPTSFFIWRSQQGDFITNEKFACQFSGRKTPLRPFLFTLPARKETNTVRICILGESAAMGTPDPAYGMPRMLQAQLQAAYPRAKFEVLNAAMRGINSYAIRKIARECAAHQVDAFVVYMGNNEMVGLHGPMPASPAWTLSLPLLRFVDWVRTLRTGQLLAAWLERGDSPTQDMDYFRACRIRADDPRRIKAAKNFRANLRDVCDAATSHGAKVVLCTLAVNLRDCPPLGSLHRLDLAVPDQVRWDELYSKGAALEMAGDCSGATNVYAQALAIDASYAELHYRVARCLDSLGKPEGAAREYQLACDFDTLQFRTDSRLNEIIREEAAARPDQEIILVDAAQEFARSNLSENGVPGQKLFFEHVHPTFAGNFLLTSLAYRALEPILREKAGRAPGQLLSESECARRIGYTPYDHVNVIAAMTRLCAGPPFLDQLDHAQRQALREQRSKQLLTAFNIDDAEKSIATYRSVLAHEPAFWPSRHALGTLLMELKRYPDSAREFQTLTEMYPDYLRFRVDLGNALLRMGQQQQALTEFTRALRIEPHDSNVRQLVARLGGSGASRRNP